jgi:hypothetical protein
LIGLFSQAGFVKTRPNRLIGNIRLLAYYCIDSGGSVFVFDWQGKLYGQQMQAEKSGKNNVQAK